MKTTEHTAGPWTDDGISNDDLIVNSQWGEVCRVRYCNDYGQRDANAKLIASAPRLLEERGVLIETLQELLAVLPVAAECPRKNCNIITYTDREWSKLVNATNKARATIAKTTLKKANS